MSEQDFDLDLDDLKRRMDGAMTALRQEFLRIARNLEQSLNVIEE